jgi:hypothetical protein
MGFISSKYAFWLAIPALFIISFIVSAAASPMPESRSSNKTKVLDQSHFDAWNYLLTDQDAVIVVDVELNRKDNVGLRQYMQANAEMVADLFKEQSVVEGRVVFRQPIRENQLPTMVSQHQDQVSAYELRIKGAKGEKFTILGAPDTIAFLPQDMIASFQHDIEHKTGGAELKGFTNITMTMTARQYQELMKSPHVLFVDVIPAVAVEKARQTFGRALQGKPVITQYAPTYWYHEEAIDP